MAELTPLEKLDAVLFVLEKYHQPQSIGKPEGEDAITIMQLLHSEGKEIHPNELHFILRKLEDDKLIYNNNDTENHYYSINFNGRIFKEQGSYVQKRNEAVAENIRLEAAERSAKANRIATFWLTLVVAAGTLVAAWYYSIEIWKYYYPFCH